MKEHAFRFVASLILVALPVLAQPSSEDYTVTASAIGANGGTSAAGDYAIDTADGILVGKSHSTDDVARHGYVGQLYDIEGISLAAAPATLPELGARQATANAIADDDTILILSGTEVDWRIGGWPLAAVTGGGMVGATSVYANTTGTVTGVYQDSTGTLYLAVVDTDPDNFGSYAGDSIPDQWQVGYFGIDNTQAVPAADPDSDGGDNYYEYITGTHPSNSTQCFRLVGIALVTGVSTQVDITFGPTQADRDYQVFLCESLTSGVWSALSSYSEFTNAPNRTARDLNANTTSLFYRVEVSYTP